jgi:hypothetical protein
MAEEEKPAEQTPQIWGDKWFGDFLSFKVMITPFYIKTIYLIGAVILILIGIGLIIGGEGTAVRVGGLLILTIGNLCWRIWCEWAIVFFRMLDLLRSIDSNTKRG